MTGFFESIQKILNKFWVKFAGIIKKKNLKKIKKKFKEIISEIWKDLDNFFEIKQLKIIKILCQISRKFGENFKKI